MKKWIKIVAITLLCVWVVIATIGMVLATRSEEDLISKNTNLAAAYKDERSAYIELEAEYDELRNSYLKGLAYEMAFDMWISAAKGENYDNEFEYYKIMAREQLSDEDMKMVVEYLGEIIQDKK